MCNAKNHRWNCNCGFGGGSAASVAPDTEATRDLFYVPHVPRRYTRPNKRCPVCSKSVFLYALANGSRVYFDEIGPPWPKHACTNKLSDFNLGVPDDGHKDWALLEYVTVEVANERTLRLSGATKGEHLVVFIRGDSTSDVQMRAAFLRESFIQARRRSGGGSDLALLTPDLRPLLIAGYPTLEDAARSNPDALAS